MPAKKKGLTRLFALAATLLCGPAFAVRWTTYGFDLERSRFNPAEHRISRTSVGRLAVRWFFPTGAPVSASPSVVHGTVYVGSWNGTMYALEASSGRMRWMFNIADPHPEDRSGFPGIQSSATVSHGKVYFGAADANVYALSARNGTVAWKVSLGDPDTAVEGAHVWSSPAVFDGTVYVGKASHIDAPCVRGAVFALDAATGAQKWRFNVLPDEVCASDTRRPCGTDADCPGSRCVPLLVCRAGTGPQLQSQLCASNADCTAPATCQGPLGGAVVSSPAVDTERRVVYVATGDCVRFGATGLANAIIALDADSGALRWAFHPLPPADLRDFDFIASPNIFRARRGGVTRRLIGARGQGRHLLRRRPGYGRARVAGGRGAGHPEPLRRLQRLDGRGLRQHLCCNVLRPAVYVRHPRLRREPRLGVSGDGMPGVQLRPSGGGQWPGGDRRQRWPVARLQCADRCRPREDRPRRRDLIGAGDRERRVFVGAGTGYFGTNQKQGVYALAPAP